MAIYLPVLAGGNVQSGKRAVSVQIGKLEINLNELHWQERMYGMQHLHSHDLGKGSLRTQSLPLRGICTYNGHNHMITRLEWRLEQLMWMKVNLPPECNDREIKQQQWLD
jgi:hypothetical protein